jgi:hypothetical protein
MASYTPDGTHQYNSLGNTNTITRVGPGQYTVTFAGLAGVHGGNVQVTPRGSDSVLCKVDGWQASGTDVTAGVFCVQGVTATDSEFLASFEAINQADPDLAYTHYDPPATPVVTETPDPTRSWDVTGIYTPTHQVLLTTPVSGFAMEHVTGDVQGADFCNFAIPPAVRCWDASGAPVDKAFSYVKGLGRIPESALRGAYAVYDIAPGDVFPSYVPGTQHSSFSSTSIVVSRLSVGLYAVLIPGAASGGSNAMVHVTAFDLGAGELVDGAPVYCKPVTWNNAGADVVVQVTCFLTPGATPTDDAFQMSYIVPP